MSDLNSTGMGHDPSGPSTGDPPPLTRRERREREEREAARAQAMTASVPVVEVSDSSHDDSAPPALRPTEEPSPSVQQSADVQPVTRRERREMEERLRAEQAESKDSPPVPVLTPQAAAADVEVGVSVVDDTVDPDPVDSDRVDSRPVDSDPVDSDPEGDQPDTEVPFLPPQPSSALPPVFGTPDGQTLSGFPLAPSDDEAEEVELALSREVGVGTPTTHALILPTTPLIDIAGPIGDTGEILVTGQIPLPRLVTEQGMQGYLDEDERFDELIGAETTSLTAPVSAVSAVSSKGNDSEFQMVRKAPWGSAATVLGASAVLLVLAAAGLLTVALLTDLLSWPL